MSQKVDLSSFLKSGAKVPTRPQNQGEKYVSLTHLKMYAHPTQEGLPQEQQTIHTAKDRLGNYTVIIEKEPEEQWTQEGFLQAEDKKEYRVRTAAALIVKTNGLDFTAPDFEQWILDTMQRKPDGSYQGNCVGTETLCFFNKRVSKYKQEGQELTGYLNVSGIPFQKTQGGAGAAGTKTAPQVGEDSEEFEPADAKGDGF